MCDFAPGERVVAVDNGGDDEDSPLPKLIVGQTYVVERVWPAGYCGKCGGCAFVDVEGVGQMETETSLWSYAACSFRRAEPPKARDLEAWLDQPTKFEGPLRREKVAS